MPQELAKLSFENGFIFSAMNPAIAKAEEELWQKLNRTLTGTPEECEPDGACFALPEGSYGARFRSSVEGMGTFVQIMVATLGTYAPLSSIGSEVRDSLASEALQISQMSATFGMEPPPLVQLVNTALLEPRTEAVRLNEVLLCDAVQ